MKTIGEIRRANLELLITQFGTMDALAIAAGTSSVYLSQVRRQAIDVKTGKAREIGGKMARRLEAAGPAPKPEGWMDVEHDDAGPGDGISLSIVGEPERAPYSAAPVEPPAPPADFSDRRTQTDSEWAILEDLRALPEPDREELRAELHAKAEKYRAYMREVLGRVNGQKTRT